MAEERCDAVLVIPNPYTAEGINDTTHEQLLGILYIGTLLQKNGFKCKIIDAKVLGLSNSEIIQQIYDFKPKLIGITLVSVSYKATKDLCEKIRNLEFSPRVILGGPHPTSLPKETLAEFNVDAVVIGEGEQTFLEIVNNLKNNLPLFQNVAGVAYKENGELKFNSSRPINANIDELPFPDHSMLPDPYLYKRRTNQSPAVPILTSRGCPYLCTFCSRDLYKNKVLFRTPKNVVNEIDYLVETFKFKQIDIIDDNFLVNKNRAKEILQMIIERPYKIAINLQSGVRVDAIDEELLIFMKKAGVYRVALGVESGDERVLKNSKKGIKLDEVRKAVKLVKQAKLRADCFFMIGLPGDNAESMQRTIDFAKELKPNTANFSMTIPFPGTELYREAKEHGQLFIDTRYGLDSGYNAANVAYLLEGMDKQEILKYYKKAYRDFYLRPIQIFRMLLDVKSIEEFKWLIKTGTSVFKSILLKN